MFMTHTTSHASDISSLVDGLSDEARALWAKSDYKDGAEWMRLHQHIADSAAVAGHLWDEFLPAATKRVFISALNEDPDLARRTMVWLVCAHDLGKASPAFAVQVDALRDKISDTGLEFHPSVYRNRSKLPHSMATFLILREWLEVRHGFPQRVSPVYAAIPLGHHGSFRSPSTEFNEGDPALLGTGTSWSSVQYEIADFAAAIAQMTPADFTELAAIRLSQPAALIASGLTILADWIASNQELFSLTTAPRADGAADLAMRSLGLPPPWRSDVPDLERLFSEHLGLDEPRPLQTAIVELANSVTGPELMILEAPTGEGKTKAAFGASEVLAARFDLGGVFFALPTQATADGIFSPVREWVTAIQGSQHLSIGLAHGKSAFNTEFRDIPRMTRIFDSDRDGATSDHGSIVAHQFLTGRRKLATMSDFVVGTIDQVLLGALCAKHVALRHLGLTGKVVVLDEIHAADTFMRQFLCRILTWLAAYRVPVIAMSATLPPSIRRELIAAYNEGLGRRTPRADPDEPMIYPRITVTSPAGSEVVPIDSSARRSAISIEEFSGPTDEIARQALTESAHGGNIAIVCDTVRRAQEVFGALRSATPSGIDLRLLHSRFLTPDRLAKEAELRERLGPGAQPGQRPLIVVATQVIEQSLDIDFDLMFSDIAPIDLVLQRAGRLHRHEWKNPDRPSAHRSARLILTGFDRDENGVPELDRGCRTVYGAAALLRCIATLDEHHAAHEVVTSPDDVAVLVTRAYESIPAPRGWEAAWAEADEAADRIHADKRSRAKQFRVPAPARRPLVNWAHIEAPSSSEEQGIAQVRDSEDSIEVVVVERVDGVRRIPGWASEMPKRSVELGTVVDDDVAYAASLNTLRLPGFLGTGRLGDQLIDELEQNCIDTWQNSRWLRGVLPLVLDANGTAVHAGHHFQYDIELGLVVTKEKQ